MGDLISREAALAAIDAHERMARRDGIKDGEMRPTLKAVREFVQALPAVDAELVRRGKWVAEDGMMPPEYHGKKRCSICAHFAMHDLYGRERLSRYCPNCGAKMEGAEK